ncbi:MAG: flagellar export chaperone FliS [Deltaproteobacteria bacterium]|nr:flagellar export chaperone FliS [Deltaproteobacteria bacterium]MBW2339997.1 flagellar export chaperone FliS [Deltaproteobacteria bacterium]
MYSNGIQTYRRTKVMTADPRKLIILCYEEAIDNLKIGKQRIAEEDFEARSKALDKAQDIICELLCSLNSEKGGSIAKGLDSLYNYMLRRIIHADVKNDLGAIDEVIGMLTELKAAWEEIFFQRDSEITTEKTVFYQENRQASGTVSA